MAPLTFSAQGFVFQDGMNILLKSYSAAQDALNEVIDRQRDDAFAYQQELEMGGNGSASATKTARLFGTKSRSSLIA